MASVGSTASGQDGIPFVRLLDYSSVWKYEASGQDLGTAWARNDYDDSAWLSGAGLLQFGEATPYPAPFNTLLPEVPGRITQYYRTRFNLPPDLDRHTLVLKAVCLVDDGCVIRLNGAEAGRVRMPAPNVGYQTLAFSGPDVEGQFDTVALSLTNLYPGENLLAVEVHQTGSSVDTVWGMELRALTYEPLIILDPPVGSTNEVGTPVTLSVEVAGTLPTFQWRVDGVNIPGATNSTYSAAGLSGNAYDFQVVAAGLVNQVTSDVARVVWVPDLTGPMVQSANAVLSQLTNSIDLLFSDPVLTSTVTPGNFRVTRLANDEPVEITSTLTSGRLVRLRVAVTNWRLFEDYFVTISNLKDIRGNIIAPETRVAVGWPRVTNVMRFDQAWFFHDAADRDPNVYFEDWTSLTYHPDGFWKYGGAVFSDAPTALCAGSAGSRVGFQYSPTLFRTKFMWPADRGPAARLDFRYALDDGAVFFLNAKEILRVNAGPGPVTINSRTAIPRQVLGCDTNSVSVDNLLPGENVVAVAVLQAAQDFIYDTLFGLEMNAYYARRPQLPAAPVPVLNAVQVNPGSVHLSWSGGGYALQSTTNLASPFSYPAGPWLEVTNMSNPMVVPVAGSFRAFRLLQK